jgi:hypothetical protein
MQPQMELTRQQEIPVEMPSPALATGPRWSAAAKIGFRFAFCYLVLYNLPFPFGSLPYTGKPGEWYEFLINKIVPWTARHILRISQPVTAVFTDSGDTTYEYVKTFSFLVIAVAAAVLWSALDRRRENYQKLHHWLRFYVRIALGFILLGYGAFKVIPSQFPPVWQWRYLETYGDSSPMGILWTFMSASPGYTIFTGSVEMLAAILLFFPRLATLGSLIAMGAMTNVFLLNMCYDVPVKLFSFHLLLFSIFLAFPAMRQLARFLILNRTAESAPAEMVFRRKWINRGLLIAQLLLCLYFTGESLYRSHNQRKSLTTINRVKPALYGTWTIDEFVADGQPRPPLTTDNLRWQKVVLETTTFLSAQGMSGQMVRYIVKMDDAQKSIALTSRADPRWKANLNYELPSAETMTMDGRFGEQKVHMKLHRIETRYLLQTRGFHWISEAPFNR